MTALHIPKKALISSHSDPDVSNQQAMNAADQSVRPYSTNQEYLWAMREDLAEWLLKLYSVNISAENFFNMLDTGTLLCKHANNVTTCAEYVRKNKIKLNYNRIKRVPKEFVVLNQGDHVRTGSFFARDNIANFISWCRNQLGISEIVMFETNDLVLRLNEKNVILCLLEVARRGSKFGVPAPVLVQMEEDIDNEIELENEARQRNEAPRKPPKKKINCDFKSLDEMVQQILGQCTCPTQFPMVKVADGKYKVGDSESIIFMRILRQHVMVRVGGGWDTLEHYLDKHDPCRCKVHRTDRPFPARHNHTQHMQSSSRTQSPSNVNTHFSRRSTSKQLLNASRLARSNNSIYDFFQSGNFDKNSDFTSASHRSKNSFSDTSSLDGRQSITRRSHFTAKPSIKLVNNKRERLSLHSNVFTRLSGRTNSTPDQRTRSSSVQQEKRLLVRRSKTGAHCVQRSAPSSPHLSPILKRRENTRDKSTTQSDQQSMKSEDEHADHRRGLTCNRSLLPRPRKDKNEGHDYRSRIPAPSILCQGMALSNPGVHRNTLKSTIATKSSSLSTKQETTISAVFQPQPVNLKGGKGSSTKTKGDFNKAETSICVVPVKTNVGNLSNLHSRHIDDEMNFNHQTAHSNSDVSEFDATLLHSSGYPTGVNLSASLFVPIENNTNDSATSSPVVFDEAYASIRSQTYSQDQLDKALPTNLDRGQIGHLDKKIIPNHTEETRRDTTPWSVIWV